MAAQQKADRAAAAAYSPGMAAAETGSRVLVVGGGSRLAGALAAHLPGNTVFVARRPCGLPGERLVAGYADLPDELFPGADCVINCVGISKGPTDLLHRVNETLPAGIAESARRAGVARFIHVSSFSVYGKAETVAAATPEQPGSAYGRSKLAGDRRLLALARCGFGVTVLRLPMLYEAGSLGKLGAMLRAWRRLRLMPVPRGDVRRAMIGVELAAEILARLVREPRDGVILAADPQPFSYQQARAARPEPLHPLALPVPLTALARVAAPALARRLFASSDLPARDNLAIELGLPSRLYADIAAARL